MSHRLPTPRGARAKPRGLAVLLIALAAILFIVVAPGVASTAPPGPDAPGADWAGDAHSDSDSDPDDTDEVDDTDTDTPAGSATDDPETTEPETTDPETTDESSAPSHPTGCGCGSSPMPGTSDTTSETTTTTTTTTSTGDPDPSTSGRETTSGRDGDGDDPSRGIRREEDAPSASDGDVSESDPAGVPANTDPAVTDVPTVAPPGGGGSTGPTPDSGSGSGSGPDTDRRSPQPDTGVESDGSDTSQTVAGAAGPPVDPPQASPGVPDDSTLTSVRKFVLGVAPGALLLLGAVALLGSGSFLDSLRSMRP